MTENRVLQSTRHPFLIVSMTSFLCFGSGLIDSSSGSGILAWIPIRIQGFDDQKLKKKFTAGKNLIFFLLKIAIFFKGRPNYRRSLQPSKENSQHFKTWNFLTVLGHFCPPGSGSGFRIWIHWPHWIRIQSGSETRQFLWCCDRYPYSIYWKYYKEKLGWNRDFFFFLIHRRVEKTCIVQYMYTVLYSTR